MVLLAAKKPIKPRPCSVCKTPFVPVRALQNVCTWECGLVKVEQKREKAARRAEKAVAALARKEGRRAREKLKTRRSLLADAQVAFNRFIRARDKDKPCICCGLPLLSGLVGGHFDCGHYRSVGSAVETSAGRLNPIFVAWMMNFPLSWFQVGGKQNQTSGE